MAQSHPIVQPQTEAARPSAMPFWLVLLGIAILINYVDRGSLAVAAPLLKDELHLSNTHVGILVTSFFWTYTLVLVASGWIVDRFNVNWVLAAGFAIWSLATAVTGVVEGFTLLLVCRLALGFGESVAFPSCSKLIALNVSNQHRGVANAMLIAGLGLGPAVGTYACGITMARYGWRPVFIAIGVASMMWLLPWLRFMPKERVAQARAGSGAGVSTLKVLRERNFWGASIGHFCGNYPFYFMITWLPLYLVKARHFTMDQMAPRAALFYVALASAALLAGWVNDLLIRNGSDSSVVRKATICIGQALVAIGVLTCAGANPKLLLAGLTVWGVGAGMVGINLYACAQALAGPAATGKWTGLQSAVSNTAGIVVGPLTGWIVDRTGHYELAFAVCAGVAVIGGLCWVVLVGPLRETVWTRAREAQPAATAVTST